MSKIGRNDPCPCGSGKKYKKCHIQSEPVAEPFFQDDADEEENNDSVKTIIDQNNSVQLIALIGALQLHPQNHGKNFRFEQLARKTLLQFDPSGKRPDALWPDLKFAIENFTNGMSMEDPLSSAFTEIAFFEEGNYTVASGIYAGFTDVLNCIIETMFLTRNALPASFIKEVRSGIGLMLFLSEAIFNDAGIKPFANPSTDPENIEFPEYDTTMKYVNAVCFDNAFIERICTMCNFDKEILNEFIVQPSDPSLQDDDPENNIVNFKPVIKSGDEIIVYMPTGIVHSLVSFIYRKAKEHGCYAELLDLVYQRQFHLTRLALSTMKWMATDIELPAPAISLPIEETVCQIDQDKLAYVCYIKPGSDSALKMIPSKERPKDLFDDRTKEVSAFLQKLRPGHTMKVFCLYIIGEVGQDFMFMWSKPEDGNQSLAFTYSELHTIANSENVDRLTLWKFAKSYNRTSRQTRLMAMGGTMDAYVMYRQHHGNIMDSDNERPLGGLLMIVNGSSDDFKREIQLKTHEHTVPIFYKGTLAYALVRRYKDYAPIYIENEVSDEFRLVIESYKMPIWITNYQVSAKKSGWAEIYCEAVAFWLYKMRHLLSPILEDLTLIQFELDIAVAEELITATEYEIKEVSPDAVVVTSEVVVPRVRISIPYEFLYMLKRPDNIADKKLMTAALEGIRKYVEATGKTIALDDQRIEEIINETLQPSRAKMMLFSDSTRNVKMDNRNLPSTRYIQDSDVSAVLDSLVSYLPKGYAIPEKLGNKAEKIKLCDDIAIALINQITNRITEFDGKALLEWLIRYYEKCIQQKEFREIIIPAKIACFSSEEDEIKELMHDEKNLITTSHALRTLIEFVATDIPVGTKLPNRDDVDELLAFTNQLTEWGALNEAIRGGIDDPEMGLLPSGRIGTDKTVEREAFKPYAIAKNESEIFQNTENFEKNYAPRELGKAEPNAETENLDAAFEAEHGFSLTLLSKVIGTLMNEGYPGGEPVVIRKESNLKTTLGKIEGITEDQITKLFALLTLLERPAIGTPPPGYQPSDIFPWRYNRPISYLRRPLVKVSKDADPTYYYGYRHLIAYFDNLMYLLHTAKYPNPVSETMIQWLGGVSGTKGNPFRKEAKEWFEENTDFEVIEYEVTMSPDGHLKTDKHLGDIDLLVIDHKNKILYPIECKNITGGRNVLEMKIEMDEYLGRNGKDKNAKMRKHVDRDAWIQANKDALLVFGKDLNTYTVKSLILTADEIPLTYLKKELPMPVRSFVFLRKRGINILNDIA